MGLVATATAASTAGGSGWMPAAMEEAVLHELSAVAGVEDVAGNRLLDWPHSDASIGINAFDAAYFGDRRFGQPYLVGARAHDVWERVAAGMGVIVSTTFAERFGARVGGTVVLHSPSGSLPLKVLGTTVAFVAASGTVEMSRELFRRHWGDARVNRVWVRTSPGVSVEVVRRAIAASVGARRPLRTFTPGELLDHYAATVRRAFRPVRFARWTVLVVLVLGLADTLLADVLGRTRDLGVLRALGARRRRLERIVVAEAAMLGGLGMLLALAMGLGLAWMWATTTFRQLLGWHVQLHFPFVEILTLAVLTLAASVLAAALPAQRVGRLAPAAALRRD